METTKIDGNRILHTVDGVEGVLMDKGLGDSVHVLVQNKHTLEIDEKVFTKGPRYAAPLLSLEKGQREELKTLFPKHTILEMTEGDHKGKIGFVRYKEEGR